MNKATIVFVFLFVFAPLNTAFSTESAETIFNQGIDYLYEGEWEKAGTSFKKAIELDPNFQKAHEYYQNVEFFFFERKDEIRTEYRERIKKDPQNAVLYVLLARILDRNSDERIELLEQAIDVDSTFTSAYTQLPWAYRPNYEKAQNILSKGLKIQPHSIELLTAQTALFASMGKPERAQDLYRKIITSYPDSIYTCMAYRELASSEENDEKRIELLEKTMTLMEKTDFAFSDVYSNLYILYKKTNPQKAVDLAEKVTRIRPPFYDRRAPLFAYQFLYDRWIKTDTTKAIDVAVQALNSNSRNFNIYSYLGFQLIQIEREIPLAIRLLNKAKKFSNPGQLWGRTHGSDYPYGQSEYSKTSEELDAYYESLLGRAKFVKKDYTEAIQHLSSAIGKMGDSALDAEGYFWLGRTYEKIEKWDDAMGAYANSLAEREDKNVRKFAERLGSQITGLKTSVPEKKVVTINELISEAQIKKSMPAPDFQAETLEGKKVSLSDYQGKVLILDFWATWCGPCLAELPYFQELVNLYKNDPSVAFLTISQDRSKDIVRKFIEKEGYTFPVIFDTGMGQLFEIEGIPVLIVIDQEGNIRYRHFGFDPNNVDFIQLMKKEIQIVLMK
ncbi:MAG: redoxin domain-containing protein [Candidatus Latescibacteria bacterium]|nr:redoxin domain-containing protein [Candidatus Latescibacterota bacterium]